MTVSARRAKRVIVPAWLRRTHRWLGVAAALFVLLLSATGVMLNHVAEWKLDRRFVQWNWLLDAYGIKAPEPSVAYADGGHHATLVGRRAYFDDEEIARDVETLAGMAMPGSLAVIATGDRLLLVTADGKLVEEIGLAGQVAGPVERVGRVDDRLVVESGGILYVSDADITALAAWDEARPPSIAWSQGTRLPPELLKSIDRQYRGQGLTVERLLLDLHSGRVFATAGILFMDLVALCLALLSLSGLYFWYRGARAKNGSSR